MSPRLALLSLLALGCASSGAAQATSRAASGPYAVAAPAPAGFDRAAAQRTTETHLRNLVRLDTQNPPGREILTARYFDSVFARIPGVERRIIEAGNERAFFVARLRAMRPTARPVLVMGHMDVVGVDTAKWETPPFEPTVKDGYLHGRGVIDDKGMLAAAATAMEILARDRARLTRDIVFFGSAGEEGGDIDIAWLVEHHPEVLHDVELALNEGGRIRVAGGIEQGRVRTVNIQTTEKVYYAVTCTATGPSGHGSVPLPENALAALARAAARIHAWRPPARLNETTRLYFARLAGIEPDTTLREAMRRVSSATDSAAVEAAAAVLSRDPLHNAVLRTGVALTIIDGGIRENVIPSEGKATFNVRTVPGEDIAAIAARMTAIAAEPQVSCALNAPPAEAPPPSPVSTPLFRSMEQAATAMAPGAVVIPFMSTGATDGAVLRARGIPTYGILPMPMPLADELRMHGDNERVPIAALGWATEFLYRVLAGVAR
jgi:acetylornithine deacetylase/succinyl-diaminopimelate desuccinylase-like protein